MSLTSDELMSAFVDEAVEHLSSIENDLLTIEKAGNAVDQVLVNRLFRAAHSIKGGAGFVGLANVKDLSHKMETILGLIRSGNLFPNSEIITVLLTASETLKQLTGNIAESDATDITASLNALDSIIQNPPDPPQTLQTVAFQMPPAAQIPEQPQSSLLESAPKPSLVSDIYADMQVSQEIVLKARKEGKHVYLLRVDTSQDGLFCGKSTVDIIDELKTYGTVLSCRNGENPDDSSDGTFRAEAAVVQIVFACILNPEDMALLLEIDKAHLTLIDDASNSIRLQESPVIQPPVLASPSRSAAPAEQSHGDADKQAYPEIVPATDIRSSIAVVPTSHPDILFPSKSEKSHPADSPPTSIRVNVRILDALMDLASELVLSRNQLIKSITMDDHRQTENIAKRVDHITSDLQRVIMLTRMQPVGNLFNKFPLVVRNLSRESGKDIAFDIEGVDVELDRSLLEAMSDPLTHLIRNAVGHGIETSDVRKSLGKPGIGKITIKATNEAGQVVIEVVDDGAGIDPNRVASKAASRGFVTEEQIRVMTDKDRLNLIFLPGFSTSERVSELSGRGVGMDVVKTNLDALGGLVDIDSTSGRGTRIRIRLPLTLAIIPSQIVSTGNERFAIPQINLEELLRIPAAKVKERVELVGNAEVVRLRGKLLPLVRVTDILGIPRTYIDQKTGLRFQDRRMAVADRRSRKTPLIADDFVAGDDADKTIRTEVRPPDPPRSESNETTPCSNIPEQFPPIFRSGADRRYRAVSALHIAVVSTGHMKYGLIVDAFHDAEEIVVKPLGRHLKACRGYAGATIMGDGSVALILDVNDLAEMAGLFPIDGAQRAGEVARETAPVIQMSADPLNLLIFRNAPDEQYAIPMNQVLRIERIHRHDILSLGGVRTIQYRGGSLRVFSIDEIARVTPLADCEHLLVIVFMIAGRELGVLATGPVDSVITDVSIDGDALKQPGIMGSVVLGDATTLLVDVLEIARTFYPDWFRDTFRTERSLPTGTTVLIVDDSRFFRTQITSFVSSEGYEVIDAEDGEAAWKILQSSDRRISLVVTDIEMPRLNGIGLTERIRSDARFAGLPIIALTTLADDRAMDRARQAGVNEYQIKLDKERLADSIAALLTTHGGYVT
jgi:two-component system chemotaxis sensor kinase CheA